MMPLSKATLTDMIAVAFIGIGISLPEPYYLPILSIGLFAFSGAITNQVAIYMLSIESLFSMGQGLLKTISIHLKLPLKI